MPSQFQNTIYDAIVVGARCAGAATAMLLARRGARVLMIDRDAPGTDTMSTHALMRAAVLQLQAWGGLDDLLKAGTPLVKKTSFIYGQERIDVDIRPTHGTDGLLAPRHHILDTVLVAQAIAAGVDVRHHAAPVGLIHGKGGHVEGAEIRTADGKVTEIRAGLVIGADGRRSWIARQVGAEVLKRSMNMTATVYGYFDGLSQDGYRWYYGTGIGGSVIPTNNGQSCVAVSVAPAEFLSLLRGQGTEAFRSIIRARLPELGEEIASASLAGRLVAFAGERGYIRRSTGPGWALVGDAGYFKDPVTAHGITDAFRDAEILAAAVASGSLSDYPEIRDRLSEPFFDLTDRIAGMAWALSELKQLHIDLNHAMKPTQEHVVAAHFHVSRAA